MNDQTNLLFEWRDQIYGLLTEALTRNDNGDKADGEEFARSLETQGEAETYLQAYSALIADRREVILLERSALAAHDVRERKLRHTLAAKKAAEAIDEVLVETPELEPEYEVLKARLTAARKEILKDHNRRAVKSVVADLTMVVHSIAKDSDPEKVTAKDWASQLRKVIAEQGELANCTPK